MGTIFSVCTSKGGVGKSTVAVHLAGALAERGRVELLDCDPQASASTWAKRALPAVGLRQAANRDALLELAGEAAEGGDVVLDVAGVQSDLLLAALLVADVAVLPVGPSSLDLDALAATARAVANARRVRGRDLRVIVLLNRADPRLLMVRDAVEVIRQLGLPLARTMVQQRVAIGDGPGQGCLAWSTPGTAGDELRAAILDILEHRTTT